MSDEFTRTPNYGLYKPDVNGDDDLWGDHWNANADTIDGLIKRLEGGAVGGMTINAALYGAVPDFVQLAGPVSWNGTTVTIAGANFTVADVGKTLIMPAGGGVASAPALVEIVGFTSPTIVTVDQVAGVPVTGANACMSVNLPTIDVPGSGGAAVGDLLTVQGGTSARPAAYLTAQITALSATIVAAGSNGPPNAVVYLRATTGHGKRSIFKGTTNASGALDTGIGLTLVDAGCLYQNLTAAATEPLIADQMQLKLPGTWTTADVGGGKGQLTISSQVLSTVPATLLRVGTGLTATGDDQAGGIVLGSVITDIIDAYNFKFAPVATSAGTNADIVFSTNTVKTRFNATFANASTTLAVTAALPSWVQASGGVGPLISGTGIVGTADPTADLATQTYITAVNRTDPAHPVLTISQPTTQGAATAAQVLINPVLTGVTANINFAPFALKPKERGVYTTLTPGTQYTVTKGGVDSGVRITPTVTALLVGCGTDNAASLAAWASDVRSAATAAAATGSVIGTGVEAILGPGNYLSTGSLNFVGMATPGLFISWRGAVLHSAPASGTVAVDMRASRWIVFEQPTIRGDLYFPPAVGIALGRFDARQGDNLHVRSPICWGSYRFAGITIQSCESTYITSGHVMNECVPPTPTAPVFSICIDGWQHWQDFIPSDFGSYTLTKDVLVSFNDLRITRVSAMAPGGGIPWSIGGTSGCHILNSYGQTTTGPAILYFGRAEREASFEIHCEAHAGAGNKGGIQDAIMLSSPGPVGGPSTGAMQFNSEFMDYFSQALNSIITYDTTGIYGSQSGQFATRGARLNVGGFGAIDVQVFDYFPGTIGSISSFSGDIILSSTAYTAPPHLMNMPASSNGTLIKGDTEQDLNFLGYLQGNSGYIRKSFAVNKDLTVNGDVTSGDGYIFGAIGEPQATLTFDGTQINSNVPINALTLPAAKTGTSYSVAAVDTSLIINPSGTFTLTLPAAAAPNAGRALRLKLIAAFAVNSASSNVVPLAGGSATTTIMPATAGKFALLQSDGTNWQIMEAN